MSTPYYKSGTVVGTKNAWGKHLTLPFPTESGKVLLTPEVRLKKDEQEFVRWARKGRLLYAVRISISMRGCRGQVMAPWDNCKRTHKT